MEKACYPKAKTTLIYLSPFPYSAFLRLYLAITPIHQKHMMGAAWKTESMDNPVFATPILTISWLA